MQSHGHWRQLIIMSINTFAVSCAICSLIGIISVSGDGIHGVKQAPDGKSGELRFSTPDIDDEDAHSLHLPDNYRCDACILLAYKMSQAFQVAEKKKRSKKMLTESDILDVLDSVCTNKFSNTGVKEVNGEKRLSGEGLDTYNSPGVMQGGGKWPIRLQQLCETYTGDIGEDEIYAAFQQDNTLKTFMCYGSGFLGYCKVKQPKKTEF